MMQQTPNQSTQQPNSSWVDEFVPDLTSTQRKLLQNGTLDALARRNIVRDVIMGIFAVSRIHNFLCNYLYESRFYLFFLHMTLFSLNITYSYIHIHIFSLSIFNISLINAENNARFYLMNFIPMKNVIITQVPNKLTDFLILFFIRLIYTPNLRISRGLP